MQSHNEMVGAAFLPSWVLREQLALVNVTPPDLPLVVRQHALWPPAPPPRRRQPASQPASSTHKHITLGQFAPQLATFAWTGGTISCMKLGN